MSVNSQQQPFFSLDAHNCQVSLRLLVRCIQFCLIYTLCTAPSLGAMRSPEQTKPWVLEAGVALRQGCKLLAYICFYFLGYLGYNLIWSFFTKLFDVEDFLWFKIFLHSSIKYFFYMRKCEKYTKVRIVYFLTEWGLHDVLSRNSSKCQRSLIRLH